MARGKQKQKLSPDTKAAVQCHQSESGNKNQSQNGDVSERSSSAPEKSSIVYMDLHSDKETRQI